jgi:pre-mRNA-processing factor 17
MDGSLGRKFGRGFIQDTAIDAFTFEEQYQSFQRSGYALDSSTAQVLGDYQSYLNNQIGLITSNVQQSSSEENNKKGTKSKDKKRKVLELLAEYGSDDEDDENAGPWAPVKESKQELLMLPPPNTSSSSGAAVAEEEKTPASAVEDSEPIDPSVHIVEPDEEDEKWEKKTERKMKFIMPPRPSRGSGVQEAKTTFHGESLVDFQGRSWMAPPQGVRPDDGEHECYIPKKCIKRLTGHSKGVQAVEFFPKTGHLLLSGSMDGKCKIWDAKEDYNVLRTYSGHSEGVRSMQFNNDGKQFLSSGFDRLVRLWDTETGQAVGSFTNRKMNYCCRFYPKNNNLFLCASSDNKIYQWDSRTGEICQEYNYHLQSCNTVTFIDDGDKFISTSDDKKVLVWQFDIPVPIKYIQEPEMHSIPSVTVHPTEQYWVGQSMDNKIVVYTAGEKVKPVKKRVYTGHNNAGYACQIGFSPNGKFMMSGDGHGQLVFWDWKSTKIYRKFQAHENGPCMGAVWHPLHPNLVATCGWDGLVKIWE